jgi:hypothetical protein
MSTHKEMGSVTCFERVGSKSEQAQVAILHLRTQEQAVGSEGQRACGEGKKHRGQEC